MYQGKERMLAALTTDECGHKKGALIEYVALCMLSCENRTAKNLFFFRSSIKGRPVQKKTKAKKSLKGSFSPRETVCVKKRALLGTFLRVPFKGYGIEKISYSCRDSNLYWEGNWRHVYYSGLKLLSFFVCNSLEASRTLTNSSSARLAMTTRASKATVTRISTTIVSRVCGVPTLSLATTKAPFLWNIEPWLGLATSQWKSP